MESRGATTRLNVAVCHHGNGQQRKDTFPGRTLCVEAVGCPTLIKPAKRIGLQLIKSKAIYGWWGKHVMPRPSLRLFTWNIVYHNEFINFKDDYNSLNVYFFKIIIQNS